MSAPDKIQYKGATYVKATELSDPSPPSPPPPPFIEGMMRNIEEMQETLDDLYAVFSALKEHGVLMRDHEIMEIWRSVDLTKNEVKGAVRSIARRWLNRESPAEIHELLRKLSR